MDKLASTIRQALPEPEEGETVAEHLDRVAAAMASAMKTLGFKPVPAEPAIGSVVSFAIRYAADGPEYSYAALRAANGAWYMTGQGGKTAYTWQALRDWVEKRHPTTAMVQVTGWEEVE